MAMEEANRTKLVNLAIGETSSAAEEKIDQLTKKVENYFTNQQQPQQQPQRYQPPQRQNQGNFSSAPIGQPQNCHYCGIPGHWKRDCRKLQRDQQQRNNQRYSQPQQSYYQSPPPPAYYSPRPQYQNNHYQPAPQLMPPATNEFKVGNKVLLHRTKAEKQWSGKFEHKWDGPFYIHEILGNGSYKLRLDDKILAKVAHGDRLKPVSYTHLTPGLDRKLTGTELAIPLISPAVQIIGDNLKINSVTGGSTTSRKREFTANKHQQHLRKETKNLR
ncbi:hypothetical protein G9A89_006038 [Geosiphon pyriformis]|nr:hypothetical protein G9A89_006038 [Geosiphon pyriformis]